MCVYLFEYGEAVDFGRFFFFELGGRDFYARSWLYFRVVWIWEDER